MNIEEVQRRLPLEGRLESSGKPDAWKLARPVWGWGRGANLKVTPRPTPHESGICGCLFLLGILSSKGQLVSESLEE
jgi:hypothetical protein